MISIVTESSTGLEAFDEVSVTTGASVGVRITGVVGVEVVTSGFGVVDVVVEVVFEVVVVGVIVVVVVVVVVVVTVEV